jgi:hypothetical protein
MTPGAAFAAEERIDAARDRVERQRTCEVERAAEREDVVAGAGAQRL